MSQITRNGGGNTEKKISLILEINIHRRKLKSGDEETNFQKAANSAHFI